MSRKKFEKKVLRNGLTVLVERVPSQAVSIGYWVKTGTRYETAEETGMAHFLEHMLFKGTPSYDAQKITDEIERVGGDFNAFTSRESTCFHVLLLKKHAALGFKVLSEILLHSHFPADELKKERKVVLQEISMVEDMPEEQVFDYLFERIYGNSGLGKPILGKPSHVRKMDRDKIKKFFKKYYRPENMVVSVCGDLTLEEVLKKLKPLSSLQWPGRKKASKQKKFTYEKAPPQKQGMWWKNAQFEQAHVLWSVPVPEWCLKDRIPLSVFNLWFGGGMSSLLYQEIRERSGLAYSVYSMHFPYPDTGDLTVYLGCESAQVRSALKKIEIIGKKIMRDGISKQQLKNTQMNLEGTILLGQDNVEAKMVSNAHYELFSTRRLTVRDVMKRIHSVKESQIQKIAEDLFKHSERAIYVLGKHPSKKEQKKLKDYSFEWIR